MAHLWILTNSFPYKPGEEFLETEIKYWAELFQGHITLLPAHATGKPRPIPLGINVDLCLARNAGKVRFLSFIEMFTSPLFRQELMWLSQNHKLSTSNFLIACYTIASVLHKYRVLKRKLVSAPCSNLVGYSYWFNDSAYAVGLLRREGLIDYLVTRGHGYDVYEERRKNNYMPLKRQFVEDFDKVYAISESGRSYLQTKYSISPDRLELARLGVPTGKTVALQSSQDKFNVLSISFCVPVKRIDRIIDALGLMAKSLKPHVLVKWVHIGDGELRAELQQRASEVLGQFDNFTYQFLGYLRNDQVLRYLETQVIDVFVNGSESEGIPVSIMEAMSHGIPAIAPSVGGIPEIINRENGWLLSSNPSIKEMAEALLSVDHFKDDRTRETARETILLQYNAAKNYTTFVENLVSKMKL